MSPSREHQYSNPGVRAAVAAGVLLLIFVVRADLSHREKSTTFDEIAHITAGVANWQTGDHRLNPENGVLQQRLVALPVWWDDEVRFPSVKSEDAEAWRRGDAWGLGFRFFYELGNDSAAMLLRARRVTLIWAVGLGVLVFWWSSLLFGPWGGVISVFALTFDPNLIAHSRLATADVPAATGFLLALWSLTLLLRRPDLRHSVLFGLCAGALALVKFSALLFVPVAVLAIAVDFLSRKNQRRISRAKRLGAGLAVAAVVAWITIWGGYGFQGAIYTHPPFPENVEGALDPSTTTLGTTGQILDRAARGRLLPRAYLLGLARTLSSAQSRTAFLDGEVRQTGWRSFFFWVFCWKTPLGILVPLVAAFALMVVTWRSLGTPQRSGLLSLLLMAAVYLAAAGTSQLNLGWRHLLPVMPVLYIGLGSLGLLIRCRARWWLAVPMVILAVESLAIHPHYLAFFNQAAGGPETGNRRLVDSSLDWGQDLPGLAKWLREEAPSGTETPVYLSYFGTGDPRAEGISAVHLPFYPDHRLRPPYELRPGIYCISATQLQGAYLPRSLGNWTPALQEQLDQAQTAIDRVAMIADPGARDRFIRGRGVAAWQQLLVGAERLRFAKLLSWLRQRQPDDQVGYSILIYRISSEELAGLFGE